MRGGLEPLTVTLRDVCFLHWPVSESAVDRLVPGWLTPDTIDGSAWVSALPMAMARFDAFGVPVRENLRAVTLRTYVRSPAGDRGVYFLSLDVSDPLAADVARRLFGLPYYDAAIEHSTEGDRTSLRARRRDDANSSIAVTYEPSGPVRSASPDTLASFLAERYRYFVDGPFGTRLVGSVGHDPWSLQSATATVTNDGLLASVGLDDPDARPLAHYSDGTEMRIGPPAPLSLDD